MLKRKQPKPPAGRHKLYEPAPDQYTPRAPRRPPTAEERALQASIAQLEQIADNKAFRKAAFEGQDKTVFAGNYYELSREAGSYVVKNIVGFQDEES